MSGENKIDLAKAFAERDKELWIDYLQMQVDRCNGHLQELIDAKKRNDAYAATINAQQVEIQALRDSASAARYQRNVAVVFAVSVLAFFVFFARA